MSSARANVYTRFIPGEELREVENWTFDAFQEQAAHHGVPESRRPERTLFGQGARAPQDPTELPGYDEGLKAGQAAGYDAGLADGLKQLTLYKQQQGQTLAQRLESVAQQFTQQLGGLEQQLAEAVVHIALDVARQVVRAELRLDPQSVVPVAREAVQTIVAPAGQLLLRAHPQDVDALREHLRPNPDGRTLNLRSDPSVTPGGCVLESEHGSVDARIETRWARAVATLGQSTLPFSLDEATRPDGDAQPGQESA